MAAKCFFGCLFNMWFPSHQRRHFCIVLFFGGFFFTCGTSNFCFHVVFVFVTLYRSHWMSTIKRSKSGMAQGIIFLYSIASSISICGSKNKGLKYHDIGQVEPVKILIQLDSHKFYIYHHQVNSNFKIKTKVHVFINVIGYFEPTKRTCLRY